MPSTNAGTADCLLISATRLALAQIAALPEASATWDPEDTVLVRFVAGQQLTRQTDAAAMLGTAALSLTEGIALVPFLEPGGAFGPAWPGHPFASPAMQASYRLREPDVTRALAVLMGPGAGPRGAERAARFLRLLTVGPRTAAVHAALGDCIRPTVTAEAPVAAPRRDGPAGPARRIDLLFDWPVGADGRRAVVAVEAKLDAGVSPGQLAAYRAEARRRARGGPVGLVLLTAWADTAEARHPAWAAVRWFALLRRWEAVLAAAGDDDPEFARLRAHLWRFVLGRGRAYR